MRSSLLIQNAFFHRSDDNILFRWPRFNAVAPDDICFLAPTACAIFLSFFFIRTRWSCCETITRGNEGSGGNNFSKGFHPWTGWLTFNESLRVTLFWKASKTSRLLCCAQMEWRVFMVWFWSYSATDNSERTTNVYYFKKMNVYTVYVYDQWN